MDDLVSRIRNNDPDLTELDLRDLSRYPKVFTVIEALGDNTTVRGLDLSGSHVGSNHIRVLIASLKRNRYIVRLYLNDVRFTTEDAIALADVMCRRGSYVAELHLNRTNFTIVQIRAFARVLALYRKPVIWGYGITLDKEVDFAIRRIKRENARAAIISYLIIHKLARNGELQTDEDVKELFKRMPRDIRVLLAKKLWATRDEIVWLFNPADRDTEGVPSAPKKLCVGCFIGTPLFHEQHDDTRRFCSSYCQFIHHHNLPDLRGMTPSQIERLIY